MIRHIHVIHTAEDARAMVALFQTHQPAVGAFDTETTGLHITMDRPFLIQFGWLYQEQIYAFTCDLEIAPKLGREVVKAANWLGAQLQVYLGHNVKYDLHMLANYGEPYTTENLSDTQFYIRYAHDALTPEKGGPPLGLKDYCAQYINREAKFHERLLDQEKTLIAKTWNSRLRLALGWTAKKISDVFESLTFDVEELDPAIRQCYVQWTVELPQEIALRMDTIVDSQQIPYNMLNRQQVIEYAGMDIVWTLEIYNKLAPVVKLRQNEQAIQFENSLIIPLWEMERVGFKIDTAYLYQAKENVRQYILERQRRLHELAGCTLSISQHARIKSLLNHRFNLVAESTNAEALSRTTADLKRNDPTNPAIEFIEIIQELRTLEKWYATYILRFMRDLRRSDHLHTQIHQVGTVSGRVTSDFQQFPKDAIKTADGRELFSPRRMVVVEGGDYDGLIYLDYSQIELRLQAMYTILVEHPEPNLIRAYAPYDCLNERGERFDCHNPNHIKTWDAPWFLAEAPLQRWEPLDVHAATTCYAFDIDPTHPDFKKLRYHGKRINFAKNYGAQLKRIQDMFPEYDLERVKKINDSYYKAFPGVRAYHDYCYRLALQQSYATNMFGVRYFNVSGHNLINMLIQGSSAFFLKWKIRQLYDYSKAAGIKSKFQMNIHDELSWVKHRDEAEVFFQFKAIMEEWADAIIPIVAEMEVSFTNWAEKKGVHTLEELWERSTLFKSTSNQMSMNS